jgi:hypothetical protein
MARNAAVCATTRNSERETRLAAWGTRIRTKINGVRFPNVYRRFRAIARTSCTACRGIARHCETPHPRGSVPSTAALTIAGLRNASPSVIRTFAAIFALGNFARALEHF